MYGDFEYFRQFCFPSSTTRITFSVFNTNVIPMEIFPSLIAFIQAFSQGPHTNPMTFIQLLDTFLVPTSLVGLEPGSRSYRQARTGKQTVVLPRNGGNIVDDIIVINVIRIPFDLFCSLPLCADAGLYVRRPPLGSRLI